VMLGGDGGENAGVLDVIVVTAAQSLEYSSCTGISYNSRGTSRRDFDKVLKEKMNR